MSRILMYCAASIAAAVLVPGATLSVAADEKRVEDGKYFDKDDVPTFNVGTDGEVDWYTYSGFRRYHSECHVCHGPDGLGGTYAPALKDSVKVLSHDEFVEVTINGRERVTASVISKMPAFGTNPNVICYLDDIYVYLKARSGETIPRGRPKKRAKKPAVATEAENDCRGES